MSENTTEIGCFEIEEYKKNLIITLGVEAPIRFAMTKDGKNFFTPDEYKGNTNSTGYAIIEDEVQQESIKEVIQYIIDKHFGGEAPDDPKYIALKNGDDCTYAKGDNKGEIYEGFEGNLAVKFKRKSDNGLPEVYSEQGELIEDYPDKRVYHDGSYGRVQIRFFAYSNSNGEGIGCDFEAVLYTDKGKKIEPKGGGGGVNKKSLFKGHSVKKGKDERNSVFGKKK